jgi:hypothetical protein
LITLSPQNPGSLPEVRHSGGASSYFAIPQAGTEENNGGFEKIFAEFLSGVNRREAEERAGARDRELRVREEAGEFRDAEVWNRRETGAVRKAESSAETEAVQGLEDGGGEDAAGAVYAAAETVQEISGYAAAARFDGGPAGEADGGEEIPPAEALEPRPPPLPAVYQSPAGEAAAALDMDVDLAGDGAEGAEPAVYSAEGAVPPPLESHRNLRTPAGAGEEAGDSAAAKDAAPEGDSPVFSGLPIVPEQESEGLSPASPENRAAPWDRERPAPPPPQDRIVQGRADGPGYSALVQGEGGRSQIPPPSGRAKADQGQEKVRDGRNARRKIELWDLREKTPESLPAAAQPLSAGQPGAESSLDPPSLDFLSGDPASPGGGERAAAPRGGAGNFEEVLARELRQNLNSDIVRSAQVVLRDKGEGLIRLSLKPESLGNVKIRLELTENKITGRIVVESGEALRAFEREIASLEQAFRDSGYESAELNAFLAQDGRGSGGREEDKPFYSSRLAADKAASRYDEALERTDTSFSGFPGNGFGPGNGHMQVNILI